MSIPTSNTGCFIAVELVRPRSDESAIPIHHKGCPILKVPWVYVYDKNCIYPCGYSRYRIQMNRIQMNTYPKCDWFEVVNDNTQNRHDCIDRATCTDDMYDEFDDLHLDDGPVKHRFGESSQFPQSCSTDKSDDVCE
jgi:hypothetical protein